MDRDHLNLKLSNVSDPANKERLRRPSFNFEKTPTKRKRQTSVSEYFLVQNLRCDGSAIYRAIKALHDQQHRKFLESEKKMLMIEEKLTETEMALKDRLLTAAENQTQKLNRDIFMQNQRIRQLKDDNENLRSKLLSLEKGIESERGEYENDRKLFETAARKYKNRAKENENRLQEVEQERKILRNRLNLKESDLENVNSNSALPHLQSKIVHLEKKIESLKMEKAYLLVQTKSLKIKLKQHSGVIEEYEAKILPEVNDFRSKLDELIENQRILKYSNNQKI